MSNITVRASKIALITLSICVIVFLTSRYFSPNADYANSSLVWRMIMQNGYQALFDWRPTPDSWFFTVYPLHFLLFYILGNDGIMPLTIATAMYTVVLTFTTANIVKKCTNSDVYWAITVIVLTAMPEIMYLAGFVGHPFAHNSTNAFGMCMLALMAYNISKRSLLITGFVGLTLIFTNASDMWISPTYFLPIILSELYMALKSRSGYAHVAILTVSLVLSVTHVVSILMGFPIQKFNIVPVEKMIENVIIAINLVGETLNILIVPNSYAFYASFFITASIATWAFVVTFKKGGIQRYIGIATYMSLMGIVSSFIISNVSLPPGPPRFFVNVIPAFAVLVLLAAFLAVRSAWVFKLTIALLVITSINSYKGPIDYKNRYVVEILNHIDFLKSHDLRYGYGDFWKMSQTVNLLSEGDITVIPLHMENNTVFHDKYVRVQTFKSWYTDEFRSKTPTRQFIAITKGHECTDVGECVTNAQNQVGKADEILNYNGYTFLVYNRRITF